MQIDAAFYNHETKTRAWPVIDVMPAMECIEEPLAVGLWNSNPWSRMAQTISPPTGAISTTRHQMLTYLTSKGLTDAQIQLISGHESKKSFRGLKSAESVRR